MLNIGCYDSSMTKSSDPAYENFGKKLTLKFVDMVIVTEGIHVRHSVHIGNRHDVFQEVSYKAQKMT